MVNVPIALILYLQKSKKKSIQVSPKCQVIQNFWATHVTSSSPMIYLD